MSKTVTKISKGEVINHVGDLIVENNIDANATVNIKDGDLIVHGDIKEGAVITVSVSEELKPVSSRAVIGNLIVMNGSSRSCNTSISIGGKKIMIGNVCIDNRIVTNDQVEEFAQNQFKITPASSSKFGNFGGAVILGRTIINGVEQKPVESKFGLATARIDGKLYQGKEIIVKGTEVLVDGVSPSQSSSSSSTASTSTRRETPPKVIIHGHLGDSVVFNSDAAMTVKGNIGVGCEISCPNGAFSAAEIGEKSKVTAHDVTATIIHKQAQITCTQNKLTAQRVNDKVTINASQAIQVAGNIGNECVLKSDYAGLNAQILGNHVNVKVAQGIEVSNIGSHATINSEYAGLLANAVGDYANIKVAQAVDIDSIGKDGSITSEYNNVCVQDDVGQETKIKAAQTIEVGATLGGNKVVSEYASITVERSVGQNSTLKASQGIHAIDVADDCKLTSEYNTVTVENVFDDVTIKASQNITVKGYCSPSATVKSEYGKVKKGNKPKPEVKKVQPSDERFLQDLRQAEALSQAEMLKNQGVFSSSSTSSTSSAVRPVAKETPTDESYLAGKFDSDMQHAIALSQAEALKKQGVFSEPVVVAPIKQASSEIPDAYICIITQEIMNDPWICMLDGQTYEKAKIEEWLKTHGTSPFNRKAIPAGLKLDDILAPNRNLKSLIDEFKAQNKAMVAPK